VVDIGVYVLKEAIEILREASEVTEEVKQ